PLEYYHSHYDEVIASAQTGQVHAGYRFVIDKLREVTRRYLQSDQRRAIDIGCGPGYILAQVAQWGFDCLGIDFNPDVVRVANEHFKIPARVARVEDLLAINAQYELALLIHVLEHVEDPAGLLKNVRQLLRPAGVLFIDLPNRNRFALRRSLSNGNFPAGDYPPHHITFWSTTALAQALKLAGYEVLQCAARPLGGEGQVADFLRHRLKLPNNRLTLGLSQVTVTLLRFLKLQGETIYAVARRID
ncbi:MAG: class I SAM-dependent methyltransferase, partial [Chloroflexi bacterium]|nr:class I SAM-dependent methyltransferase [Chloroflexota bacterium]